MRGLHPRGSRRTAAIFLLIGLAGLVSAILLAILPVTASVAGGGATQCGAPFTVIFGSAGVSGDLGQACTDAAMPRSVVAATLAGLTVVLLLMAVYVWFWPAPPDALAGSPGSFKILSVLGFVAVLAVAFGLPHALGFDWPWQHWEIVGMALSAVYGTAIVSFAQRRWPSPAQPH